MFIMAGTTGLEPATSCVTGMHSNQLNYAPAGWILLSGGTIAHKFRLVQHAPMPTLPRD